MDKTAATVLWEVYRKKAYGTDELPPVQERELSLAFYAGVEAAFTMVSTVTEYVESDRMAAEMLVSFRAQNRETAKTVNLDRADGKS